jgi:hypothetical protein
MIRRLASYLVLACLWPAGAALAQETSPPAAPPSDANPWAFGLGLGLSRSNDEGSLYYSANLRRAIHFKAPAEGSAGAAASAPEPEQGRHPRLYAEPEVGYWTRTSDTGAREKDLMVGVNLVGVVPTKAFDLFLGAGFGAHFLDSDVFQGGVLARESSTHFGANIQFGVEADISQSVGLFGEGRVDLVDTTPSQQSKVWAGLRFRF